MWMKRVVPIFLLCFPLLISCRHRPADFQATQFGITQSSEACEKGDLTKSGRSILFEVKKGVFYGFSVGSENMTYGYSVPLYFWIDNRTNEPQWFDTCDTGWLTLHGYNIYDSQGHRVPERREEETSRPSPVGLCILSCTMNIEFSVPPHTCNKPQTGYNLAESYSLPPGTYTLAFVDRTRCGPPDEVLPQGAKRLNFTILPYTGR